MSAPTDACEKLPSCNFVGGWLKIHEVELELCNLVFCNVKAKLFDPLGLRKQTWTCPITFSELDTKQTDRVTQ